MIQIFIKEKKDQIKIQNCLILLHLLVYILIKKSKTNLNLNNTLFCYTQNQLQQGDIINYNKKECVPSIYFNKKT